MPVGTVDWERCADGPLRVQQVIKLPSATDTLEQSPIQGFIRQKCFSTFTVSQPPWKVARKSTWVDSRFPQGWEGRRKHIEEWTGKVCGYGLSKVSNIHKKFPWQLMS
jgi:hypothetical protein